VISGCTLKIVSEFIPTYRVSTGFENPGKSLNLEKISQDWKVFENQ
jgi:hypothetical protein